MSALLSPAVAGTLRYEFLMATRARALWIAALPLVALAALFAALAPHPPGATSASILSSWALMLSLIATLGPAIALADRFARLRTLGLGELLATSPVSTSARMAAALGASLAAALAPATLVLLAVGAALTITRGDPAALGWALIALVAVVVPAALALVTFAVAAASVIPVVFVRVGVVALWLWATVLNTALVALPTPTGTLLSPLGDYVTAAWMHGDRLWAGAGWAPLSPQPGIAAAWLNLAAIAAVSVLFFAIARLAAAWRR